VSDDDMALEAGTIRRHFTRAASSYDDAAVLQRATADELIGRLSVVRLEPGVVVDLGCGTGYGLGLLAERYPQALRIGIDHAVTMARAAARDGHGAPLAGDAHRLPLTDACVDLVVSNLAMQWCDLNDAFAQAWRVLRPGGLFVFTTFGPDTLKELRAAWAGVDDRPHVHEFVDMHNLGDLLMLSGFTEPIMDAQWLTMTYDSVHGLLADLKSLGAENAMRGRRRSLTGRRRFQAFRDRYEAFRDGEGRLPSTWEIVYGHAWKPHDRPRRVEVPVSGIR
jgi:malonyl-CoA O-methyltransferase